MCTFWYTKYDTANAECVVAVLNLPRHLNIRMYLVVCQMLVLCGNGSAYHQNVASPGSTRIIVSPHAKFWRVPLNGRIECSWGIQFLTSHYFWETVEDGHIVTMED